MKLAILAVIALSGCTGFNTAQSVVADRGAQVADEVRDSAEFALCKGITIGAWIRAYGSAPTKAAAWRELCAPTVTQTPAK